MRSLLSRLQTTRKFFHQLLLFAALFACAGFNSYGREIRPNAVESAAQLTSCDRAKQIMQDRVRLEAGDCFDQSPEFFLK